MGYEVLDVGASQAPLGRGGVPGQGAVPGQGGVPRVRRPDDPEVVDLAALPAPRQAPGYARSRVRGPAWLASPTAIRTRTAVGLLLVLSVGLVGGGAWTGWHQQQQRVAEQRATLAVTALTDSWTRLRWTRRPVVDVVVRVVNTGPLAVDVVASSFGERRRTGGPYVRALAGGLRVAPGGELAVSLLQRLDCWSSSPMSLDLPVRTADGEVHQVPVRRGGPQRLVPRQVCAEAAGDLAVSASLAGSLSQPAVELRNGTSGPVTVSLDPASPLGRTAPAPPVTVSTAPPLPITIPPYSLRLVRIDVRARDCTAGMAELEWSTGEGVLALVGRSGAPDPGGEPSTDAARLPLQVDLTALVGAAVQRRCG